MGLKHALLSVSYPLSRALTWPALWDAYVDRKRGMSGAISSKVESTYVSCAVEVPASSHMGFIRNHSQFVEPIKSQHLVQLILARCENGPLWSYFDIAYY